MATPKQEKLIKLILENLGNPNKTETLGKLIKKAGYSDAMAKNPQMIFESKTIQSGIEDFVKQIDDKRRRALTKITDKKLDKSSAKDLSQIVDVLTKNHQLLTGGETERSKQPILVEFINGKDNNKDTN
jgi:hypothetical protein